MRIKLLRNLLRHDQSKEYKIALAGVIIALLSVLASAWSVTESQKSFRAQFRPYLGFDVYSDGAGNLLKTNLRNTGFVPANKVIMQIKYPYNGVTQILTDSIGIVLPNDSDAESTFWINDMFKNALKRGSSLVSTIEFTAYYQGINTKDHETNLKYESSIFIDSDGSRSVDLERIDGYAN